MTSVIELPRVARRDSCVVALHCSLGSGRQWGKLAAALGSDHPVIAPDISGYGGHPVRFDLPMSLKEEVELLADRLDEAKGPIHLVGHSYGGAIAFKIATASRFANRVRSLTLIEPVLTTLLADDAADRRLHEHFLRLSRDISENLWNGMVLEAIDKFTEFWNGSGPQDPLPAVARLRMIERAEKLAFDLTAAFAEENVAARAASLRVPTLLVSGGLSPILTQRIVCRLATLIAGAHTRHLPGAGHMLPITHAAGINPEIVRHIATADAMAELSLAAE